MLLIITITHCAATEFGFLLMKDAANVHTTDLNVGRATLFYPEASEERCTAAITLRSSRLMTTWNAFLTKAAESAWVIADGLQLAALTGLRREDLVTLKWSQVTEVAVAKNAHKRSQGKRLFASTPRIPALDELLEELEGRHRADGVETVLVNKHGRPWTGDGFTGRFNRVRDAAGIARIDKKDIDTKSEHLHDLRGAFATR